MTAWPERVQESPGHDSPHEAMASKSDESIRIQTSIVVVTYNNRREIDACLHSLCAYSSHAEIIVVDNQSTDGTLEHVRQQYPHVRTIKSDLNDGFGAGVNRGVSIAQGRNLAIINPDIEVQAGWLEPLIGILERQPEVGLVTPTILLNEPSGRANACGNRAHITGLTFCIGLHQPAPPTDTAPRDVPAISGAAFLLRRAVWDQLGGFDEQFFMYLEDTDISWRVLRLGYRIWHVPASQVWHDYELTMSAIKMYYLEYNRLLMLYRNLAPATLAILSPALATAEALIWAYCIQKGGAYRAAKWRSYRHLWRDRAMIRRGTVASPYPDRTLLRTLNARIAVEQLDGSKAATAINHLLTAFFALWHVVALATVRW